MATIFITIAQNAATVVAAAPLGSAFLFQAGLHRLTTPLPVRSGDRFEGQTRGGRWLSILSGAQILQNWTIDNGRWWTRGPSQHGEIIPGDVCRPDHPRCKYPEDLFMDDQVKTHVETLEEVRPGTWHFDYATNRIDVGDNPFGKLVELSVTPHLFRPDNAASRVRIENLIVEKFASPTAAAAVNLGGSNVGAMDWEINRCEVRWCHGTGIGMDAECRASSNYVHHNGTFGFGGAGWNIVVENNEVSWNNTTGVNSFWGAGGSKFVYTTGMVCRGNYFHHNDGPGIWFDINNIDGVIEYNRVEDNQLAGIFWEISYAATIRRNTCKRNGLGRLFPGWPTEAEITIVGSPNVEVHDNQVEGSSQGITGLADHRGSGIHGPWDLINLNVHDNYTVVTHGVPGSGWGLTGVGETNGSGAFSPAANNRYDRNVYTAPEGFAWGGQVLNWVGWQAVGQDPNGRVT